MKSDSPKSKNQEGSSKKLKTVKVGTVLEWLSDDGYGWSKVKYGNATGHIQNSRIDKKNISTWRIGTVTGNEVRIRKKPVDGAVTAYANKGDKLTVICQIFGGKMQVGHLFHTRARIGIFRAGT